MKEAVRQTRSHLMDLFKRHGFNPRSDLGQNFLIDLNIIDFIIEKAQLCGKDVVLEVGAGTAGMTTFMALSAAEVISVEYDSNMYQLAQEATAVYSNVTLINTDALQSKNTLSPEVIERVEEALAVSSKRRLKLVSNLPYNIATPVVSNLVATDLPWTEMVITIQLELGQRMVAKPGDSHYGALSVWLQSQARVKMLKKLKPNVFWPRPKVNSAIMRILAAPELKAQIDNREFFQDFLRRVFQHRRKFLRGVLIGMYRKQVEKPVIDEVLAEAKLKEGVRAEELHVSTLVNLGNLLNARIPSNEGKTEKKTEGQSEP